MLFQILSILVVFQFKFKNPAMDRKICVWESKNFTVRTLRWCVTDTLPP